MNDTLKPSRLKRKICSTCLSSDRKILILNEQSDLYQVYRLITSEFVADLDSLSDQSLEACWECVAKLKKFNNFKRQVQTAQEHLRGIKESKDPNLALFSQPLSSLQILLKLGYDKVYVEQHTVQTECSQNINTSEIIKNEPEDIIEKDTGHEEILGVPGILGNETSVSHIEVKIEPLATDIGQKGHTHNILPETHIFGTLKEPNQSTLLENSLLTEPKHTPLIEVRRKKKRNKNKSDIRCGYITEYMNEDDMLAFREEAKKKIYYADAAYKCENCVLGFYTKQHFEEHNEYAHKPREGTAPCKVCYSYVEEGRVSQHVQSHYVRHVCRLCGHAEASVRCAQLHVQTHTETDADSTPVKIRPMRMRRKKQSKEAQDANEEAKMLRKLLSKTKSGYKCLYCDMHFEHTRYRKSHMDRHHKERLQCDHCQKKFVNRTTLIGHLRLHEGPLPRQECTICHKMVRVLQFKYHLQRHENKQTYECKDCDKVFSTLMTYQGHLKYSRAHASDQILKFPCPRCNKGYPTQQAMQDHFNYQHLGKTSHKCPICNKPIASKAYIERHLMRVHGEKKEKPKNHVCQQCGKGFTDKRSLTQHEVIHSGDRPLSCDICEQTFKQKATLYTHKKRVHNITPAKKVLEFIKEKEMEESS